MVVKRLVLRNFRSYGNNKNEIEFETDKGCLILLSAPNGSGKSSIQMGLDYGIYSEIKNNGKKIKQSSIPNRLNNNLEVEVDFESKGADIKVLRETNPSVFDITINGEKQNRSGKGNKQDIIDKYLDFDIDMWKSFISMSVNDFKNFMSLKPEEKRMLLDKLFNLELINMVSKSLKEQKKQFVNKKNVLEAEIRSFQQSINEFESSIKKVIEANESNALSEIAELREKMNSRKDEYSLLQENVKNFEQKVVDISSELSKIQEAGSTVKNNISNTKQQIELYNSGKCPRCGTNLSDSTFDSYRNELDITLAGFEKTRLELMDEYKSLNTQKEEISLELRRVNENFTILKTYLKDTKSKIDALLTGSDVNENKKNTNIIEQIQESIHKIQESKSTVKTELDETELEESYYDKMLKLFSNDGIKKSIISKIVVPINHYIGENMDMLGLDFKIRLDDEFNADISINNMLIEAETLSTGELKKSNIAILCAYLKLIRTKIHVNVLFLDEVFSSIDVDSIYTTLELFRNFANEYKINIFLVHHAMLEPSYFDKVWKIEKNITSNIIKIK
jgi:DNA repair exonuclease SbcCD ATPase subunit